MAGGLNTYAYVGGNPINKIDPLGLTDCDILAALRVAEQIVNRDGLSNVNVPSSVRRGELDPNLGITEMGWIFRPVTLDNRYWMDLTSYGHLQLFEVVLHESMHRGQGFFYQWYGEDRIESEHAEITQRASRFARDYFTEFEEARKSLCECK